MFLGKSSAAIDSVIAAPSTATLGAAGAVAAVAAPPPSSCARRVAAPPSAMTAAGAAAIGFTSVFTNAAISVSVLKSVVSVSGRSAPSPRAASNRLWNSAEARESMPVFISGSSADTL